MSLLGEHPVLAQLLLGLIAGAVVWPLACALHRGLRWPADSRAFWWGALALVLLPAPLARLLPSALAERFDSLVPAALVPLEFEGPGGGLEEVVDASIAALGWPDPVSVLASVYVLGLVWLILHRVAGHARLRAVLAKSKPLPALALPGPRSRRLRAALARRGIELRGTEQPLSPFALSSPHPQILLPRALLARLDDPQCWLLLRHEAAHLQLRDPQWMRLLDALCALHWFNPFVWALGRRLRLATELRCDRPAIRQKHMRRAYAEAYLETLRMSAAHALPCAAAAFSAHDQGHHKMRIAHILSAAPPARKSVLRRMMLLVFAAGGAAVLTAAQAASIGRLEVASAVATPALASGSPATASAAPRLRGPIIGGRVSSHFGKVRASISTTPHRGIDLVAARGTPVRSPAAGRVLSAEASYSLAPKYGTVVVIDHGDGWQTLYAHLDSFTVKAGDTVQAGDSLGTVGSTGVATGPHVHVEVHRDGERVDPAQAIEDIVSPR